MLRPGLRACGTEPGAAWANAARPQRREAPAPRGPSATGPVLAQPAIISRVPEPLCIAPRFCGPPQSANGGYFAGLVAAHAQGPVAVRLLRPPPLAVPLEVRVADDGLIEVLRQGEPVATTRRQPLSVPDVAAPDYLQAVEASRHCRGLTQHPFPTCFVCGPQRARGDGLRIFPGLLESEASDSGARVAAPWVADDSLDAGDGKVRPEFMWAALDCPGWFAASPDARVALLGEFVAHVDRRVHIGERCVVVGWRIARSGRKHESGTALFDEDLQLCAYARAIWVEPRGPRGGRDENAT